MVSCHPKRKIVDSCEDATPRTENPSTVVKMRKPGSRILDTVADFPGKRRFRQRHGRKSHPAPRQARTPTKPGKELGLVYIYIDFSTVAPNSDASACGRTVSVGTIFGARAGVISWPRTHQKNVTPHNIQQHTARQE